MFRGVNNINLDAKGRLAIPTKYRDRLVELSAGKLVITIDLDECLLIYPTPDWEVVEQKLAALPSLNKDARRLQRLLLGHATDCEMDANGRVVLPPPLREYAELDKHTVLIGQGNKFELWNEATWSASRAEWLKVNEDKELKLSDELATLSI